MRDKILFILLALFIATGVASFFYFFETYETEQDIGYSQRAHQLPFLAAVQFLEGLGKDVNYEIETLDFETISENDIIFLSKVDSILITSKQIDEAIAWLRKGGQIIVGAGNETSSIDSLLSRFDVEATLIDSDDLDDLDDFDSSEKKLSDILKQQNKRLDKLEAESKQNTQESNPSNSDDVSTAIDDTEDEDDEDTDVMSVTFDGIKEPLEVKLGDYIFLQHPSLNDIENNSDLDYTLVAWTGNQSGAHLLQFELGDGMLSVLSSSEMWKNYTIDELDNAYLLAELVGGSEEVHFHFNLHALPLHQLLMKHFPEALALLMAALLFWLWHGFIRVARVENEPIGQRRALSEHLAATTELFAKHQRYDLLIEPLVADVEQQMNHIVSEFDQRDVNEKIELLIQHTGLDHQLIKNWFDDIAQTNNNETFLNVVRIGKLIRNKI